MNNEHGLMNVEVRSFYGQPLRLFRCENDANNHKALANGFETQKCDYKAHPNNYEGFPNDFEISANN